MPDHQTVRHGFVRILESGCALSSQAAYENASTSLSLHIAKNQKRFATGSFFAEMGYFVVSVIAYQLGSRDIRSFRCMRGVAVFCIVSTAVLLRFDRARTTFEQNGAFWYPRHHRFLCGVHRYARNVSRSSACVAVAPDRRDGSFALYACPVGDFFEHGIPCIQSYHPRHSEPVHPLFPFHA